MKPSQTLVCVVLLLCSSLSFAITEDPNNIQYDSKNLLVESFAAPNSGAEIRFTGQHPGYFGAIYLDGKGAEGLYQALVQPIERTSNTSGVTLAKYGPGISCFRQDYKGPEYTFSCQIYMDYREGKTIEPSSYTDKQPRQQEGFVQKFLCK